MRFISQAVFFITLIIGMSFAVSFASAQQADADLLDSADRYLRSGEIDLGSEIYEHVYLKTRSNSGSDSLAIRAQLGMARAKHLSGQLDSSLTLYYASMDKAKSAGIDQFDSDIYMGIGVLNSQSRHYDDAIRYLRMADSLSADNPLKRMQIQINLANTYMDAGQTVDAMRYFGTSLHLAESAGQLPFQAVIHTNLSQLYIKNQEWHSAIDHASQSLAIREKLMQPPSVITYNNLGYAYANSGKLSEAEAVYLRVLPYAVGIEKQALLNNLKDLKILEGDHKTALRYFQQYDRLKDSIQAQELESKIAEITEAYQSAEKSTQIAALEAENRMQTRQMWLLFWGGLIIFSLLALAAFLFYKNERVKRELTLSKTKNQLILAQLNPHFIFNSLQHIQQYLYQNDKDTSMAYLSNFARLIRLILEHSEEEWVAFDEEAELLDKYLYLQQMASTVPFTYSVEIDQNMVNSPTKIPAMLIQPFVENAVKHGIADRDDAQIMIRTTLQGDHLHVSVIDNGLGRLGRKVDNPNQIHKSMGSRLIQHRIEELNRQYPDFVNLKIDDSSNDTKFPGTKVELVFNLRAISKRNGL